MESRIVIEVESQGERGPPTEEVEGVKEGCTVGRNWNNMVGN